MKKCFEVIYVWKEDYGSFRQVRKLCEEKDGAIYPEIPVDHAERLTCIWVIPESEANDDSRI
jgi:hypothetical protein